MSNTPKSPAQNEQDSVQTWVTSQWKNLPEPGHFSAEINTIILHTDGVTEAEDTNGRMFGLERLRQSAFQHHKCSAEEIKSKVLGDLMAFIGTQKIYDDITLIVMKHR